jgi:hypothetical protein
LGQKLFDRVDEFGDIEREIDVLLGYSLRALCIDDRANQLKDTRFTQPSVHVADALYCYHNAIIVTTPPPAGGVAMLPGAA